MNSDSPLGGVLRGVLLSKGSPCVVSASCSGGAIANEWESFQLWSQRTRVVSVGADSA